MRLLLLNYEFPPFGGGASAATYHMARDLVVRGHEIDVLTSGTRGMAAEEVIDGITVHRVWSLRRGVHDAGLIAAATYCVSAARRLRALTRTRDFDCAHFFFALPTGALAPLWLRRTKRPYIVSLRGSDVPGYDEGKMLATLHRLLRGPTRRILSGASQVVANSISLRTLARRSFPETPVDVITNGVCTTTFRPDPLKRPNHPPQLVCVARLVNRKGLEILLRAMAHPGLPECELKIVGEGRLLLELKTLARKLRVADRVVFAGRLHGEKLSRCYQRADCFVLPSLVESFSMSLLEAMASGLPVVASRTGGIPELVEDELNGRLVVPGDVKALAEGLTWMLGSEQRRRGIGLANREKIRAGYSWARIVEAYEQNCYGPAAAGTVFGGRAEHVAKTQS